jgi:hypothetical protein
MAQQVCDVAAQGVTRGKSVRFDAPKSLRFDAPPPGCSETTIRPGVPCIE